MKKSASFVLLLSLAFCARMQATTITFGAGPTAATLQNSDGSVIPAGSLIWEGVFSSTGSFAYNPAVSVAINVANIESANGWQQFGLNPSTQVSETSTNTLAISNVLGNAKYGGQVTDNNTGSPTASADFFNGKTLYIWVFNGTTVSNSTQMGIFSSTSWVFPTNTANSPVGSDTGAFNSTYTTTITPAAASVGTAAQGNSGTPTVLKLVATPEPSTVATLFGATGLLAMLRRRRTE